MRRDDNALIAPGEHGGQFQVDAVHERIGMPMHELPLDVLPMGADLSSRDSEYPG